MNVDSITIGTRYRRDLGDIAELAASMKDVGLLQPIVITPDRVLVAGERRLTAAKELGWTDIEVHVVDDLDTAAALLRAERDENTCRKDFTLTEEHALYNALLRMEGLRAKQRQRDHAGTAPGKHSGKVSQTVRAKEAAADAATGSKGRHRTLDKVGHVKDVAEDDSKPETLRATAGKALANMDETGKADGAYRQVKTAERVAELIEQFPELAHYQDSPDDVVRLGEALLGYDEPELSMRRDNLRKTIAAEQRREDAPPEPAEPNYYLLAQDMFYAANAAAQTISKSGGPDAFAAALDVADPIDIQNWEDQFAALASTCRQIASACQPQLRRIK